MINYRYLFPFNSFDNTKAVSTRRLKKIDEQMNMQMCPNFVEIFRESINIESVTQLVEIKCTRTSRYPRAYETTKRRKKEFSFQHG